MKIKKVIDVVLQILIGLTLCCSVASGIIDILRGDFLKFNWLVPVGYIALLYLYVFDGEPDTPIEENGRWPTWADAMSHCSPEIKGFWRLELEKRGIDVDGKRE